MSDARWFEVDSDIEAAVGHCLRSVELYRKGGLDAPGLDGYQAQMALMHALQSAHTSLEGGLLRILEMLGEERPVGENWHMDLIRRVGAARAHPFYVAVWLKRRTRRAGFGTVPLTITTAFASRRPRAQSMRRKSLPMG